MPPSRLLIVLLALAACLLAGCGTPYATVPDGRGEPVMLLGHDPVAYFTRGEPRRGRVELRVSLPQRTYYFETDEHRRLFDLYS